MSNRWQNAWMIAKTDLLRYKFGMAVTILFGIYMGFCTIVMLHGARADGVDSQFMNTVLDFVVLILVNNLGFVFNRRAFRYWSDDSHRKYLIKLRTKPTSLESIVLARYITMSIVTVANGIMFFTIQFIYMSKYAEMISTSSFLVYTLVMIVFSTIMHPMFLWMEWRYSGKKYMVGVFIVMALILLAAILVGWTGNSIFYLILELVETWPLVTTIVSVVLLVQAIPLGMRLTFQTLRRVDLM